MTARAQLVEMIEFIPERELPIVLEVVKRFISSTADDLATENDHEAHHIAMQEYERGETISHDAVNWD